MTAHHLAKLLLAGPDLPVVVNGWSSDEGFEFEVSGVAPDDRSFYSGDGTPVDSNGYEVVRPCLVVEYANRRQ